MNRFNHPGKQNMGPSKNSVLTKKKHQPYSKQQTVGIINPFNRDSPFSRPKNEKGLVANFSLKEFYRNHCLCKKNMKHNCLEMNNRYSHDSVSSFSSISSDLSLRSNKQRFEKEFSIQRERMKLFGPEIIRYKVHESSIVKEYYNEKVAVQKPNRNQRNHYATQQYFFVQSQPKSNVPNTQAHRTSCISNLSQKEEPLQKETQGKRSLKMKKSLSWQNQLEDRVNQFPTFRNPSFDIQQNKLPLTENSIEKLRQTFGETNLDEDKIIERTSRSSDSMIDLGMGNALNFNSSQMSKVGRYNLPKSFLSKQSSSQQWGKYDSIDLECMNSNARQKKSKKNSRICKQSENRKNVDKKLGRRQYPSSLYYDHRQFTRLNG